MASGMPEMNWDHEPQQSEDFKASCARLIVFFLDHKISDSTKQAIEIKIALGDEGMRHILASSLSNSEQANPTNIWALDCIAG